MAAINILTARKNEKKRKPAESYDEIRKRKNEAFRQRKLPLGRTLSEESVTDILKEAQNMGCNALFDLGAGEGLILNQAKDLGFSVVGGIEIDESLANKNDDIFNTSFADFNQEIAWENRLKEGLKKSTNESSAAANPAKTLFYIYEGGLWEPQWCLDAIGVIKQLANTDDLICLITHAGTVSVKASSWDIDQWEENLQSWCFLLGILPVYGKKQPDTQKEVQTAYLFQVTTLRF